MQRVTSFLTSSLLVYFQEASQGSISHVSSIQGDQLGWYIWLERNKGVYELIHFASNTLREQEESKFLLKYYPYPDSTYFEGLACAEQVVRLSDIFDDSLIKLNHTGGCACSSLSCKGQHSQRVKGIPRILARKKMNPSLFSVGELDFVMKGNRLREMSLTSQDRWIQYSVSGLIVKQEGVLAQVLAPGEIDRNLPGWEICWEFIDVLVKEVFSKLGLYSQGCTRVAKPGKIYYSREGGEIEGVEDPGVTFITHTFYY